MIAFLPHVYNSPQKCVNHDFEIVFIYIGDIKTRILIMANDKVSLESRSRIGNTAGYKYTFNKLDDNKKIVGSIIVNDYDGDGFDSHDGVINKKFGVVTIPIFESMMAEDRTRRGYEDIPDGPMNPATRQEYKNVKGEETDEGYNITSPETEEFNLGSLANPLISKENVTNENNETGNSSTNPFNQSNCNCSELPLFSRTENTCIKPQMHINMAAAQDFYNYFSSKLSRLSTFGMFKPWGIMNDMGCGSFQPDEIMGNMDYGPFQSNVYLQSSMNNLAFEMFNGSKGLIDFCPGASANVNPPSSNKDKDTGTGTDTNPASTKKKSDASAGNTDATDDNTKDEEKVEPKKAEYKRKSTFSKDQVGNTIESYIDENGNGVAEIHHKVTNEIIYKSILVRGTNSYAREYHSGIKGQEPILGENIYKVTQSGRDFYARSHKDSQGKETIEYYNAKDCSYFLTTTVDTEGNRTTTVQDPSKKPEKKTVTAKKQEAMTIGGMMTNAAQQGAII